MNDKQIRQLYQRYLNGETSEQENNQLRQELANPANQELAESLLHDSFENEPAAHELSEEQQQQILSNIFRQEPKVKRLWPRIAAAAAILIFLSVGVYLLKYKPTEQAANNRNNLVVNDIAPGHNQATLTLSNGQKIVLTKGLKGQLAVQHNTSIKANDNNIVYNAQNENEVAYNILTTARGETSPYPLVLADGTKVWLNAESSITFPTAFNGKERVVKITGEAYFEVKHNEKQPFKVQTPTQTIEDIGTSFDVNAYADEPATRTTLVEGSVKIGKLVLKPGEQTDGLHTKTVNTELYSAWKENLFQYRDQDIQSIMRELARWYDIDVGYQGPVTKERFNCRITKNRNISAVLRLLERTQGIHFKIEGRRVTVIE